MSRLWLAAAFSLGTVSAQAAIVRPEDAGNYVGQPATVCGQVLSGHFAARSRAQPTFLDMGGAYPHEAFAAVIFGEDRAKFGAPEDLVGRQVCVTGTIGLYRGRPEMILHDPSQLTE